MAAHSQGAAILSAALDFLEEDQRRRINVTTYGGAAYFFPLDLGSLRQVVNIVDFVPLFAGATVPSLFSNRIRGTVEFTLFLGQGVHPFSAYMDYEQGIKDKRLRKAERDLAGIGASLFFTH